jgi:hypothetical protein
MKMAGPSVMLTLLDSDARASTQKEKSHFEAIPN